MYLYCLGPLSNWIFFKIYFILIIQYFHGFGFLSTSCATSFSMFVLLFIVVLLCIVLFDLMSLQMKVTPQWFLVYK